MTSPADSVADAIEACRSRIREHWGDVGTPNDDAVKTLSPLWHLIRAVAQTGSADASRIQLNRLVQFVARRVLPCWELYCDSDQPRRTAEAIDRTLNREADGSLSDDLLTPASPAYRGIAIVDCRACDTSCSAECVSHAARFIVEGALNEAYLCLGYADMAFDQSPLGPGDHFRPWLLDVAVPIALECRGMTAAESQSLRNYDELEISNERERASRFCPD